MTRTALRICPLCEATCGLALTIDEGRVTHARGDRGDVLSAGFICPKGASFGALDADPDRLRQPLIRRDGRLTEATWPEAFAAIADGMGAVIGEHGGEAVGVMLGNLNAHTVAAASTRPNWSALWASAVCSRPARRTRCPSTSPAAICSATPTDPRPRPGPHRPPRAHWRQPAGVLVAKAAPALAAGCAVVLKPAEDTPLVAQQFVEILHEAGLPAGVFNLVTGLGPVAGQTLAEHPGVDRSPSPVPLRLDGRSARSPGPPSSGWPSNSAASRPM